jgi:hypothetical protein
MEEQCPRKLLDPVVEIDDPAVIPALAQTGEKLGRMILDDEIDEKAFHPPGVIG